MKNLLKILKFLTKHPIGQKRKLQTIFRFIFWQLSSQVNISPKKFNFVNNSKLLLSRKQTVATGNYYVGLLEFEEMSFLLHLINKNDTFFDIGTNIGAYSILASGVCCARSLAFEPISETVRALKKNVALNRLDEKINVFNIGIAESEKVLSFTTDLDVKNHVVNDPENPNNNGKLRKIKVRQLNDFKDYRPTLIKIDTEGYEKQVLDGAGIILKDKNLKAVIIEINHESERYNVSGQEIHDKLSDFGFKLYSYEPFTRKLAQITNTANDNRIYIRDIDFVRKRVTKSAAFKVRNTLI